MKKPRKRKRNTGEQAQLEMTPMIDVVFQLLIFFVVTLKKEDVFSRLDVNRPSGETSAKDEKITGILDISIYNGGYLMDKKALQYKDIEKVLIRTGAISKDTSVVIRCAPDSPHSYLIRLLDGCSKAGLGSISVFSL